MHVNSCTIAAKRIISSVLPVNVLNDQRALDGELPVVKALITCI